MNKANYQPGLMIHREVYSRISSPILYSFESQVENKSWLRLYWRMQVGLARPVGTILQNRLEEAINNE